MALQRRGADAFVGLPAPDKGETLFGGQLLAQCLMAAFATLPESRAVHSLHAYFLRPGDVDAPTDILVERVRDGRGFSSRQALAAQDGKERFRMVASFQAPAQSPVYCRASMPQAPPPEEVGATYDDFTLAQTGETTWYGSARPMDVLYVNPPGARGEPVTAPQLMWMRVRDAQPAAQKEQSAAANAGMEGPASLSVSVPDPEMTTCMEVPTSLAVSAPDAGVETPRGKTGPAPDGPPVAPWAEPATLHQAGLAYLSDATLVDHIMLPHGLRWQDADFVGTSLDHAMWFHRPAPADEWLLFEQIPVVTGAGRGLAQGRFFTQSGDLVASCVQEGLMRWRA